MINLPPRPLTPKQEAYLARWLANGFDALEAYRHTYNTTNMRPAAMRVEANKVIRTEPVQRRLAELRAADPSIPMPTVEQPLAVQILPPRPAKADKAWLLDSAMQIWEAAHRSGNLGQAKGALELIGKLTGDLVDRKELRVVRSWQDLTDAEINALAAGEAIDAEISDTEDTTE